MAEHLEILGQTGSGKSFFEKTILMDRARLRGTHIVVIATKPADETLESTGWPIIDHWPPSYKQNQVIFWAKGGLSPEQQLRQKRKILDLLNKLWVPKSNRIVAFDEVAYLDGDLGMRKQLVTYYREARTLGISLIGSTQRPQGVPRYMHSESAWSVFFSPKDEDDAERMAQVAGGKRLYMPILMDLNREKYEFLMVRNLTGEKYISHVTKRRVRKARVSDDGRAKVVLKQ